MGARGYHPARPFMAPELGPDSLERMIAAGPRPTTRGDMIEQAAELRAWARTMNRAPRAERFRGSDRREYFVRAPFRQNALNVEEGVFRGVASVLGSLVEAWCPT